MLQVYLLIFAGEYSFNACQSWVKNEGTFVLMPVAVIHTYRLVSLLFFSLPKAIVRAHSQLLLGSCNFESSICGYTSDGEFAGWSLHKDGIGTLFVLDSNQCFTWVVEIILALTVNNLNPIWCPFMPHMQHLELVRWQKNAFKKKKYCYETPDLKMNHTHTLQHLSWIISDNNRK